METEIRVNNFHLRPWWVEDATWYVESRDDEVFEWTNEDRSLTVEAAEEAIRRVTGDPDLHCFAIADDQTGELLGNIALVVENENVKSAEIMYWLASWGRGRGIATRAVSLLCEWAFDQLKVKRIALKILRGNIRSQRVAERAGFHLQETQPGGPAEEYVWYERSAT
jgi:RimJ/RimL family protein N-acetyltransferase